MDSPYLDIVWFILSRVNDTYLLLSKVIFQGWIFYLVITNSTVIFIYIFLLLEQNAKVFISLWLNILKNDLKKYCYLV